MSPGENMDCREAFERLYDFLDGELDANTTAAVREHLELCSKCFAVFDFEKAFLMFVEARARAQGAPESVRRRVMDSLLDELGEDGPG